MDQELDIIPRCNHVKTNGERCGSPALRNQSFCYYHKQLRRPASTNRIPHFETPAAMSITIRNIVQMLLSKRIDPKTATAAFYGIQVAGNLDTGTPYVDEEECVTEEPVEDVNEEYLAGRASQLREELLNMAPRRSEYKTDGEHIGALVTYQTSVIEAEMKVLRQMDMEKQEATKKLDATSEVKEPTSQAA